MAKWCYVTDQSPETYKALNRVERAAFIRIFLAWGAKPRFMVAKRR